MKSLDDLRELREQSLKNIQTRSADNKPRIIIGMGTCGIAAGARKVLTSIIEEVNNKDLDIVITQTGCIGMCEKEPLIDVEMPNEPRITYGHVNAENVKKIISEHVLNGNIVESLVIAKMES
jgi:NADP-reducing hydrogenase subunit HndB